MLFYHPIENEGNIQGHMSGNIKDDVLFIENVFIFPEYRGKRLAAQAMAELIRAAIQNKIKKISLRAIPYGDFEESKDVINYSKSNQKKLTKYYKTMGFKTIKPYHEHVMELNL